MDPNAYQDHLRWMLMQAVNDEHSLLRELEDLRAEIAALRKRINPST